MTWFVAGLAIGALGAGLLLRQGQIPGLPERTDQVDDRPPAGERGLLDETEGADRDARYDFFTVLPEMEVVVPERDLARPQAQSPGTDTESADRYLLQAGSFRSAADADEMKARLALLGSVARVQKVTVDDQTWHRVRIGPVSGSREADRLRRQLQDNGIDVLVLKGAD